MSGVWSPTGEDGLALYTAGLYRCTECTAVFTLSGDTTSLPALRHPPLPGVGVGAGLPTQEFLSLTP